jgi:ABC-type branched-subunit amino acid transport system substrate-binding protein
VEALTKWLSDEKAKSIGIVYNGDDAYSHDLYTYFVQSLPDKKVTVALSNMYKEGDKSFFREIKAIESAKPEAIIFLGSYEDRMAFLESIAQQPQAEFWQKRLKKIRWIE